MGSPDDHDEKLALHARRASSFGAHAEHRPDYPAAALRWALAAVAHRHPPTVLDLGAGTGKLEERAEVLGRITAYLRERPETAAGEFDLPIVTLALRTLCAPPTERLLTHTK
ncbi:hypothetical protein [Nocardia beijingensis]